MYKLNFKLLISIIGFAKNYRGVHRMFQQGVVSFGIDCGKSGAAPGVYTRVSKFMCWILDNMEQ